MAIRIHKFVTHLDEASAIAYLKELVRTGGRTESEGGQGYDIVSWDLESGGQGEAYYAATAQVILVESISPEGLYSLRPKTVRCAPRPMPAEAA